MKEFTMGISDWERFWDKVNITNKDSCWEWIAAKNNDGYGRFGLNGKLVSPHRLMWAQINQKDVPDGIKVCHSCDNPSCVNPNHLFGGTHSDNMKDAYAKGRIEPEERLTKDVCRMGARSAGVRELERKEVFEILDRWYSGEEARSIASDFSTVHSTVLNIKDKKTYTDWVNEWERSHRPVRS